MVPWYRAKHTDFDIKYEKASIFDVQYDGS